METSERGAADLRSMDAYELRRMLELGDAITILDVRGLEGYQASDAEIAGAIRMSMNELDSRMEEISPDELLVTYGSTATDGEADAVAQRLIREGFRDVRPLRGGFEAYVLAGGPLVPRSRER